MDVTGMTELAVAGWQGRHGQDLGMRMLRHAAQQDAAVLQLVAEAAQDGAAQQKSAVSSHGIGRLLDVHI